ncbi:MAG TPA: Asp23/Gls24 family envelope stress response protein [Candidatus Ruthenibacterium merdigallinarum]|nr:Asp23/Gls24 family envelope stress response protein [Candidatus Ruthenibacterium merdigallinarum]
MDVLKSSAVGGSLQISTDVIAKIARLATLEVDGVQAVCGENLGVKGLLPKARALKPIEVSLSEDVAQITVSIQVRYGSKVPALAEKVQESVKSAVQNMTGITVSKVNVVVAGVAVPSTEPGEAE